MKTKLPFGRKPDWRKVWRRVRVWAVNRPLWVKFFISVLLLSTLTSLLVVGFYDRFYGTSPISNRGRLVKEALAICEQAQTLAAASVDFSDWPLKSTYDLEGQGLGTAVEFFANATAYASADGPSSADSYAATAWLKEKYPDYFSSQERCDTLVQEYQSKYSY